MTLKRVGFAGDSMSESLKKKSVQDRGGGGDKEAVLFCYYGNWRLGPQLKESARSKKIFSKYRIYSK